MTNAIFQYKGAIHIHTKHSDGTGNVRSISLEAKRAGLDWIIITDHNYYDTEEGIYNGVYVIKGEEISPKNDNNHYLTFGINEQIPASNDPQININTVRNRGGFGFAAHPFESAKRKNKWSPIVWTDTDIIPDGVEIWNWFSAWGDALDDGNLFKLAYSYFFKHNLVALPSQKTLDWWDELNQKSERIVPALGGFDAHAIKIYKYILPVTVFPYKTSFETITNVITLKEPLSKNFAEAKEQILNSIKYGKNVIINRKICKDIPQISVSNTDMKVYSGDYITLSDNTYYNVKVHDIMDIKLIKDGKEIETIQSNEYHFPIKECGRYRVEIIYKNKGYAYSNPVKVVQG